MESYLYKARDAGGLMREGVLRASTRNDALEALHQRALTPILIEATSAQKKGIQPTLRGRVKSAELAALCWQLSTMVEGGVPITTALEIAAEDTGNSNLKVILHRTLLNVSQGRLFSDGLREFPQVFARVGVAIVIAGETSGNLGHALETLAAYYDSKDRLSKKVKSAMAYPVFVLVLITLIIIAIMVFVVPRFDAIFKQLGGRLPAFTAGFLHFHQFMCHNVAYIIAAAVIGVGGTIVLFKTKQGHALLSGVALKLPLFGRLASEVFAANFCTTAATLLEAGVPVLDVLEVVKGMTTNDVLSAAVATAKQRITEGASMAASMSTAGVFPNLVVKMIQVGEESGSLSIVLRKTSDHYERRVGATIDTATNLLGPVMIVAVGAIVLVTVIALYLPVFSISDVAR
jgi:type IV pilus assembly protein PilC